MGIGPIRMAFVSAGLCIMACGGEPSCPAGSHAEGGRCVALDAGEGGERDAGGCSECGGTTPYCDVERGRCVECLANEHCDDEHCQAGICVECRNSEDCTDAEASLCSGGVCYPCRDHDHCRHIEGRNACHSEDEGYLGNRCVECTSDNVDACGDKVCDEAANSCSDEPAGSADQCDACLSNAHCREGQICAVPVGRSSDRRRCYWLRESTVPDGPRGDCANLDPPAGVDEASGHYGIEICVPPESCARMSCESCASDGECWADGLCVPMVFAGTDVGSYCLPRSRSEDPVACPFRGFAEEREVTSVDGVTAPVCAPAHTTCPAYMDRVRGTSCASPGDWGEECGVLGLDDGWCLAWTSGAGASCVIECRIDADCPIPRSCDTTHTPPVCR